MCAYNSVLQLCVVYVMWVMCACVCIQFCTPIVCSVCYVGYVCLCVMLCTVCMCCVLLGLCDVCVCVAKT